MGVSACAAGMEKIRPARIVAMQARREMMRVEGKVFTDRFINAFSGESTAEANPHCSHSIWPEAKFG